jgi:hypothetical protein
MGSISLMDVPRGKVPDYRTFVRHAWAYSGDEGRVLSPPPWIYCCIFENDKEWPTVRRVARTLIGEGRVSYAKVESVEAALVAYELRFSDLAALHRFLVDLAVSSENEIARQVAEFMMWTLGFRWV